MKIKEFLTEEKPNTNGTERLVSSILGMMKGKKKPARLEVKMYLRRIERDKAFMDRIKRRAREVGNDGYKWAAIRYRTIEHFSK